MKLVFILLVVILIVWIVSRSRREYDRNSGYESGMGSSSDSKSSGSNCKDNDSCNGCGKD